MKITAINNALTFYIIFPTKRKIHAELQGEQSGSCYKVLTGKYVLWQIHLFLFRERWQAMSLSPTMYPVFLLLFLGGDRNGCLKQMYATCESIASSLPLYFLSFLELKDLQKHSGDSNMDLHNIEQAI